VLKRAFSIVDRSNRVCQFGGEGKAQKDHREKGNTRTEHVNYAAYRIEGLGLSPKVGTYSCPRHLNIQYIHTALVLSERWRGWSD
jgi:hypothetical protein